MEDLTLDILRDRLKDFLKKKENQNYLYLSFFFLVFSFSVVFIIRPVLKVAFEMRQKRDDLAAAVKTLDSTVEKIVDYNVELERYRDDLHLLEEAFPDKMQVYNLIVSLKSVFESNNLSIDSVSLEEIPLVLPEENLEQNKKVKKILLNYTLTGRFSDFLKALEEVYNHRRLKIIEGISVTKNSKSEELISTEEAEVRINLKVESYFR